MQGLTDTSSTALLPAGVSALLSAGASALLSALLLLLLSALQLLSALSPPLHVLHILHTGAGARRAPLLVPCCE